MKRAPAMRSIVRSSVQSAVAAAVLCGAFGCSRDEAYRPSPPAIHLLDLDGRPVDLWRPDRVTVVVFTRTDCPISNRAAPEIRRLYETYHPRGADFFLIYVDPREQPDAIRRHLQDYDYRCPGLRDPKHTLVARCGATVTPEAAVFGKDGAMTYLGRVDDQYADVGQPRAQATAHDLADAIESTLLGQPVARPRTKAVGCLIADLKD